MNSSKPTSTKKLVIFASGSGTNAENIIKHFQNSGKAEVVAVFSNNRNAKVLKRAHDLKVKALHFDREALYDSNEVLHLIKDLKPDLIILAGFLWLFPVKILQKFPNKVINLHPALLPKFGGKGMFGDAVHKAVIDQKEKESGITIHYVDQNYDEGKTIFQTSFLIEPNMTYTDLAEKIHEQEYRHFPRVIDEILENS